MPTTDLNDAIRSLVAEQVSVVLDPYRDMLERLQRLVEPVAREDGANRAAPARSQRRNHGRTRGSKAKDGARPAPRIVVGKTVEYRQGRGAFQACVTGIDKTTGTVLLERLSDGKEVMRPVGKVAAVEGRKAGAVARRAKPQKVPRPSTKPQSSPKTRKPGGLLKPMQPDEVLAKIVGAEPQPLSVVVKKVWSHIKANALQDEKNGRMINPDDKLGVVFDGKPQVAMFEISKLVSKHLS